MQLCYVLPKKSNFATMRFHYELYFTETLDVVWGRDWDVINFASTYEDIASSIPDLSTCCAIVDLYTDFRLKTIEEMPCFSMEQAINKTVALCWIDLTGLDEYPENGRFVLHFGDDLDKIKKMADKCNFELSDNIAKLF